MISIFSSGLPIEYILLMALAFIIAIFIGITFHEFAHAFMAYKCGDATAKYNNRMSLNPINHFDPMGFLLLAVAGFGWAKPVPINPNNFNHYKKGLVWVSLAGIITNIIIAFIICPIGFVFLRYLPNSLGLFKFFLTTVTTYTFSINMTLAVFNLLPIYPLDGFNFISAVTRPYNKFVQFMRAYGQYILLGIFILSAGSTFIPGLSISPISWLVEKISWPIEWFWSLIFGLF